MSPNFLDVVPNDKIVERIEFNNKIVLILLILLTFYSLIKILYKFLALFTGKPYSDEKLKIWKEVEKDPKYQEKINKLKIIKEKSSKKRLIISIISLILSFIITFKLFKTYDVCHCYYRIGMPRAAAF